MLYSNCQRNCTTENGRIEVAGFKSKLVDVAETEEVSGKEILPKGRLIVRFALGMQ